MVQTITSPDGACTLTSSTWDLGWLWLWIIGLVAGCIWIGTLYWPLLIIFILIGVPLLIAVNPFWAVHFVVIRRHGRIKNWHIKFCSIDTKKTEYLWLPEGDALLIAQSDENWWHLYRYDLEDYKTRCRDFFHQLLPCFIDFPLFDSRRPKMHVAKPGQDQAVHQAKQE